MSLSKLIASFTVSVMALVAVYVAILSLLVFFGFIPFQSSSINH